VTGTRGSSKMRAIPGMTRVGRWLRRTSLDECRSSSNVLSAKCRWLEPRPTPLRGGVLRRSATTHAFDVQPESRGPWQVAGRNQVTDFEQ